MSLGGFHGPVVILSDTVLPIKAESFFTCVWVWSFGDLSSLFCPNSTKHWYEEYFVQIYGRNGWTFPNLRRENMVHCCHSLLRKGHRQKWKPKLNLSTFLQIKRTMIYTQHRSLEKNTKVHPVWFDSRISSQSGFSSAKILQFSTRLGQDNNCVSVLVNRLIADIMFVEHHLRVLHPGWGDCSANDVAEKIWKELLHL